MMELVDNLSFKAILVPAVLLTVFLLERVFPVIHFANGLRRLARNFSLAALNAILSPLLVVPLAALAANWSWAWRPDWLLGWNGLILDLIVLDLWIYWWHRFNHKMPFLWRFHVVHHLDETLDSTSAVRFHFGEVILSSLVRAGVIVILAAPLWHIVVFEALVATASIFHHSNMKLPKLLEHLISKVVVTPSIHWVHHHAIRADTDSNYATILSVWDKLFKSQSRTVRTVEMPIGVEGKSDRSILSLIAGPLGKD